MNSFILLAVFSFLFLLFFLLILHLILGISFIWGYYKGAPYVRSQKNRIKTMLELAQIRPGETVVDLGSGDGILIREAVKQGAKAIGVEINPLLAWYSKRKISSKNCCIIRCNIHDYSLTRTRPQLR